ncbi:hypothetical protein ['Camptotheca acuminata' phytoplasma]|uniref:hypothetical protein n=1 Tax='Camptotheca acuminata' phytoplasma TaxID=3239192 RepID=UPI003519F492
MSIILVALQDKLFLKTYKEYTNKNNKELLNHLYTACHRVLTENKLDDSKINIILSEYKKLQHKKILIDDKITKNQQQINNTMLQDFINKFKEDILPFVNEKKFDILGRFYTQFIKYVGKEASLGLVLTPPHITNFFTK